MIGASGKIHQATVEATIEAYKGVDFTPLAVPSAFLICLYLVVRPVAFQPKNSFGKRHIGWAVTDLVCIVWVCLVLAAYKF